MFLVDMPLSPDLAQWLRAEAHDAGTSLNSPCTEARTWSSFG